MFMDDKKALSLAFTSMDLALIFSELSILPLVLPEGFPKSWSAEQIKKAMWQAWESSTARHYVRVQPDGNIAIDTTVAALVGTLAFAESSLAATGIIKDASPGVRWVHFASGLIVEHEQQPDGTHLLTAVRDRETAIQRLDEYLHLSNQPAPVGEPCMISEEDIKEARCVAVVEGKTACAAILGSAGVSPETASSLADALSHPICQSTLLALSWQGREARQMGSLTLLEGVQGLWLSQPLRRDGEPWVEVIPCNASYAAQHVEELIRLAIPAMGS